MLMMKITIPYFSFEYDVDFLLTKQSVLHISVWRIAFYSHISSSLIILLAGIIQFIKTVIIHKPQIHRAIGKVYISLILFVSAPAGFVMAIYANGGIAAKTSFGIISVLWWYFTFTAYRKVRAGKIQEHLNFMYRSFALTLSAITLRIYVLVLPSVIHLPAKEMYTLVSFLSWIPNLMVAEWLIRKTFFYKDVILKPQEQAAQ
ncbi:MAG: hypothetical protein K0Q95_785 [Bacteroidota bacterium]|jgi:uncharacterized membrane protein|nr:hypothetical protein [Bacteroidota bacterium]